MIFWVFGGTAVGKKRFIARCIDPKTRPDYIESANLRAEWIPDGNATFDIVAESKRADLMLRWQWGRDETLDNLCIQHRGIPHTIVLLSVGLMSQLSRIALREGCLKWDAGNVHGEQRDIYERVHEIAMRHRLPVLYVDATNDDYTLRKQVA